jgi:general L-amino acid transport system permease protein
LWLLLQGGALGLERVPTNLWGGLLVTLALTIVGIIGSFPLGILLALGRRSTLPVVRLFCTIYIEVVRGVPLITFFFMAQLLLPLFLDADLRVDNLIRAMVAVTLFSAAYLAENVRGGLQAIPRGQYEAARALGLNYFYTTIFITLPQALRIVIPALVGQFIGLFKDTSLVSIVGILDLIGISAAVRAQPEWLGLPGGVFREVLFFLALVYFIISFAMSRVSLQLERNLGVGTR